MRQWQFCSMTALPEIKMRWQELVWLWSFCYTSKLSCYPLFLQISSSSSPTLSHEPVAQVWLIIVPCFSQLSDDSGEDRTSSWACAVLCQVTQSCLTLRPHGLQPTRLLYPWGFSRQQYWNGLPCPPPGDLPNPGIEPRSPALPADSLLSEPPGKPKNTGVGIPSPGELPNQLSYQGSPQLSLSEYFPGIPKSEIGGTTVLSQGLWCQKDTKLDDCALWSTF